MNVRNTVHRTDPTYEDIVALWTPHLTMLLALDRLPEAQREARVRLSVAVLVGLSLDYLGSGNAHAYADAYRDWVRLNLGI